MAIRINENIASLSAQKSLSKVTGRLMDNFNHLSTGLRIASAADDAAGLGVSERMRAQVTSLRQASRNANDGISLIQTAEGALDEVSNILNRMRELAVASANGTYSDSDKDTLDQEMDDLISEVDRISNTTNFNNLSLLNAASTITFQVGAGTTTNDTISVGLTSVLSSDLGIDATTIDISSASGASPTTAIAAIDAAIDSVTSTRGTLGASQNRLQSTIANLDVSIEALSAAESRIRDVDVAFESADLTRNTILQQAALSILSQANVQPQSALTLLG